MHDTVKQPVTPLFLFSMPRAGSTLTQRILASHAQIASAAEPWILLPYVYSMRAEGVLAHYRHFQTVRAIRDFCKELPEGRRSYLHALRDFVCRLYSEAAGPNVRYFLDKSPPYCLIASEILEIFPEAKAVFLFRTPGAIAASMNETFDRGRWTVPSWKPYLYEGMQNMLEAFAQNRDRVHALRFEDLVTDPEAECRKLFEYLEIPFEPSVVHEFSAVRFKGRLGDQTGRYTYEDISREPLEKWKKTMANTLRKAWLRRYLRWLGAERLALMGYELNELLREVRTLRSGTRFLLSDLSRMVRAPLTAILEPHLVLRKLKRLPDTHRIYKHY